MKNIVRSISHALHKRSPVDSSTTAATGRKPTVVKSVPPRVRHDDCAAKPSRQRSVAVEIPDAKVQQRDDPRATAVVSAMLEADRRLTDVVNLLLAQRVMVDQVHAACDHFEEAIAPFSKTLGTGQATTKDDGLTDTELRGTRIIRVLKALNKPGQDPTIALKRLGDLHQKTWQVVGASKSHALLFDLGMAAKAELVHHVAPLAATLPPEQLAHYVDAAEFLADNKSSHAAPTEELSSEAKPYGTLGFGGVIPGSSMTQDDLDSFTRFARAAPSGKPQAAENDDGTVVLRKPKSTARPKTRNAMAQLIHAINHDQDWQKIQKACLTIDAKLGSIARAKPNGPTVAELRGQQILMGIHALAKQSDGLAQLDKLNECLDNLQKTGVKDPLMAHLAVAVKSHLLLIARSQVKPGNTGLDDKDYRSASEAWKVWPDLSKIAHEITSLLPICGLATFRPNGNGVQILTPSFGSESEPFPGTLLSVKQLIGVVSDSVAANKLRKAKALKLAEMVKNESNLSSIDKQDLKLINAELKWLMSTDSFVPQEHNPSIIRLASAIARPN